MPQEIIIVWECTKQSCIIIHDIKFIGIDFAVIFINTILLTTR